MTPERLIGTAQPRALSVETIPGSSEPAYTVREVGIGFAGIHKDERERAFAAFAWRQTGDVKQRGVLYAHLCKEIFLGYDLHWMQSEDRSRWPLVVRENWPLLIAGQHYINKLIVLSFDEDHQARHPNEPFVLDPMHPYFQRFLERRGLMEINETLWRRKLERKYMAIRQIVDTWYAIAKYHAEDRLQEA